MIVVEPYARIHAIHGLSTDMMGWQDAGIHALRFVEYCARVSHASEDAQTADSWQRFIEFVVMQKGDWSVTEHVNVTVDFLVDRGITHELVRHRVASYTQESTRFVNYEKKKPARFILPIGIKGIGAWQTSISSSEQMYLEMLKSGDSPQIARSVLPNALASRLLVTANLRSWRQILIMRTTEEAHPQMRQVMIPLLEQFQRKIPILYSDIIPLTKQSRAISTPR